LQYWVFHCFQANKYILKNILSDKSKILMYLRGSLAITFSASVVLSPLVAYYFNTFSLISFVANLFVVPIFSLV
jgi:predicted membrane metal-binding protein